jgi:DNA primase
LATDLENVIEEIQSKLDIAEIVGSYIPLRRAGRNFKACCPFHNEKTPSFVVSPAKQIYHCFGCGAGGDTISFVMKHENIEFMEALNILADKAGVEIPRFKSSAYGKSRSSSSTLHRINEFAANYYNALLIGSAKANNARRYLVKRALNADIVSKFKLGFASGEWDSLLKFAGVKGVSAATLEKAGLVIPGKENSFYDRFRNRIIFPIFDLRSKVVAFGGRVLDDELPKYMNSPETDAYVKGKHLYGLNFAIEEIKAKDYVIIVEGYLDLIIPYQSGIGNIAATLGTALTVEQIKLIKRFTNNVVIIFDADEAGEAASLRGLDLLVSEGLFVKIATLPQGQDPDDYVCKNGKDGFLKIIQGADNLFDYKLKLLLKKFNPAQSEEKTKISNEMLPTIKRVENSVLRADYISRLSKTLFITEDALNDELSKIKLDYSYPGEARKVNKQNFDIRPAERIIAGLMVEDPDIAQKVREELRRDDFNSREIRDIVTVIYHLLDENKIPNAARVIHNLNDDHLSHIICEALSETENFIDREKSFKDCILRIKRDNMICKRAKITGLIREAERQGDDTGLMGLMRQLDMLKSERV